MKKTLRAAEVAKLLEREFARLKPTECKTCKPPMPFWGPGVRTGTGYWYLKMMPACEFQCGRVISKLWADITSEYEIERSPAETGQARFEGALHESGRRTRRRQVIKGT
jgi:hypothetical protein